MPTKLEAFSQMADNAARQITGSYQSWTAFLQTAARLYKYPFHEQLMIHAQRPDATACAEYDFWNEKMGRYVRKGSKGIALIDTSGDNPRLRYVFDVSDTGSRPSSRSVNLWVLSEKAGPEVGNTLAQIYNTNANTDLRKHIEAIAAQLADEYWNANQQDILDILADSFLEGYDEFSTGVSFRTAVTVSAAYVIMSRCNLHPEHYFGHEDFLSVFDWSTLDTATAIGCAVSSISQQVLRQIEIEVRKQERTQRHAERSHENEGTELQAGRGLSDSRSDTQRTGTEAIGQVRQNAQSVSERAQTDSVEPPPAEREAVLSPEGDRRNSESKDGTDDAGADEAQRSDREVESRKPDDLGSNDEQSQSAGRGDYSEGAGIQLSLFPTEEEQILKIDEAESAANAPSAFSMCVPQNTIDHILRLAGNQDSGRMEIVSEFSKNKGNKKNAEFLKTFFRGGNGIISEDGRFSAWYAEDGIHIATGNTARYLPFAHIIPWDEAADRISTMLQEGTFATNVELDEANHHERIELAQSLWYLQRDLTDEAREASFLSCMDNLHGGFSEETEHLAECLNDPKFLERLISEVNALYIQNSDSVPLLRFRFHKPGKILEDLKDLSLPRIEYTSDMAEIPEIRGFITEDEIAQALAGGSSIEEGKGRIYEYAIAKHSTKEFADFLKREYGIGGHSHAVSGATQSSEDHDSKGISLKKNGCTEVQMNWADVAKRITELIRKDRYLTPLEHEKYNAIQDAPTVYNAVKERNPDNIVLYQVGDFFEMYGEDAKTASQELDLYLTTRNIPGTGRVDMCGIPAHRLESYVEKLRDKHDVTISAVNEETHERSTYTLLSIDHEAESATNAHEAEFGADGYRAFPDTAQEDDERFAVIQDDIPEYTVETVAEYPAEENSLPFDVVIQTLKAEEPDPPLQNYRISDDHLGEGGAKAKFRANMDAINLLKELELNGRHANTNEQEILSKYVGWGGLADAFDESKSAWEDEFKELYVTLSPEEYAAARASTLNAHYTSPVIIRAMYDALSSMGFTGGNILEPSMGIGNFFGLLPDQMSDSKLYGIELDSLSGRIARQLYPNADITIAGFETTDRSDFFDVAIGNVPFGQYQVNDSAYNKLGFNIHNYFFAKALDQLRPGGVVAFITSRYTMDAKSPEVRKYLAQRAEFLGAIRLPNNAFKANAGADVVSDIIFLQKRDRPIIAEPDWVHLGENEDGFAINSYFVEHPEMILGRQSSESTQFGRKDFTVLPLENVDLKDQLAEAITNIQGTYSEAELPDLGKGEEIDRSIPADPSVKNYSYTLVDGEVYFRENSRMVKPNLNATALERVKGMIELRNCVQKLIAKQMDGYVSDDEIRQIQSDLNRLYDRFSDKYGLINSRANELAFSDDSSYFLLCSLEILDEDKKLERKADIFTKRTIRPHEVVTSVDTVSEALALSISERARVDIHYMESLTGKQEDELISDLRGVIFRVPPEHPDAVPEYQTADEYLSGNVRQKLRVAEKMAKDNPEYLPNVEALRAAQPKDLDASEIEIRLGATWIDKDDIEQFMYETFQTPRYMQWNCKVNFSPFTAEWAISAKTHYSYADVNAYVTYGTQRANAYKILEDTLNLRDVRIYDTVQDLDGKERRVLNNKETTLAQQKQQAIKDAFADWIWKDPERRQRLVAKYNELFNSDRPREYDGQHITFSGMNPEIQLREHQLNAVAHILYGGNTLLAHEVGAGKTFEMIAAAMESKRLGLCQKPLFTVPNHLTEQWASEFLRLYPSANILVATKKDFEPRNRKKFCARIATGSYDAVIIGHSQFEKIPMSQERQEQLLQDQIDEIEEGIADLKASRAERFTVKQLEKTKRSLEVKLKKLQDTKRKDDVITFEQLGVDRLYVDEAHNYKNLFLYTKMRNVAGLSTTDAQKSSDMLLKCRYLDEITGNKGIVFATGTPVSNSMTELYTMMRYLQHDTLRQRGLAHFDCWASTFGETATAIELAPEGTGYRARTRFSKFFNLPELMTLFKQVADIKTSDQLNLPVPEAIYHNVVAQPTEIQQEMVQELSRRASRVHSGSVASTEDNMLKITSDGRKLGLDQRIINSDLPDDAQSKVNQCVDNVFRIWNDGQPNKLAQLIFCDLSTPSGKPAQSKASEKGLPESSELHALEHIIDDESQEQAFCVYDDIREKLVARGIPREQIAFIHEANTEARKKELFAKVRSGQVRVLIGSTFKMGAGMNVRATRS